MADQVPHEADDAAASGAGDPSAASPPLTRREARERAAMSGDQTSTNQPSADQASAAPIVPRTPAVPEPSVPAFRPVHDAGPDAPASAEPATVDDIFGQHAFVAPSKADKRARRRRGWRNAFITLLVLLAAGAGAAWWAWSNYEPQIRELLGWVEPADYVEGEASGEVLITIASGDNPSVISRTLAEAGVTRTPNAFYDHLIATSQNPTFYPGTYRLQLRMTSAAALAAILDPANKMEHTLAVPEGYTLAQILPRLATALGVSDDEVRTATSDPAAYGVSAASLEGWLFPATYTFEPGTTPGQAVQQMVDRMVRALDEASVPPGDRERILIVASIVQREAREGADFAKVARVIYNRLDPANTETFGLLQMDSTAQYGFGQMHSGSVSTTAEALADQNDWNTYVVTGLPIGPISNPGDEAIRAAMQPADGPWLYFVTVNLETGETVFSTTLAEHEQGVAQWQQWCRSNPNQGC